MLKEMLIQRSKEIIKLNQHARGGYVACPLFPNYLYSWLRDGTFIAFSMDVTGEYESSALFYNWVHGVVVSKKEQVHRLIHKQHNKEWIDRSEFLNTRYHLDGRDDTSEWGNFQLDGYGAWLWGLSEHIRRTGNTFLLEHFRESIELTIDYLETFWLFPNYDCWEENPDFVHPSTLACIYGGLKAIGELEGRDALIEKAEEIKQFILKHAVSQQRFVKSIQYQHNEWVPVQPGVDANLLWLALPFGVIEPEHPYMQNTIRQIEQELKHGGIQRYTADAYYGGGEWILLTAWYGWIQAELGQLEEAKKCMDWIVSKADSLGRLPEQVPDVMRQPELYADWVGKWGTPASPLLWSHAMLLVLSSKL